MKERPIIFSAPMVRAILGGRKTQTRRVIKPHPHDVITYVGADDKPYGEYGLVLEADYPNVIQKNTRCPYGRPGDRLWVRETSMPAIDAGGADYRYAADYDAEGRAGMAQLQRWTPSIHMPRKASRILLEITDVRVERLTDISDADAIAEGCKGQNYPPDHNGDVSAKEQYHDLWNHINKAHPWATNPWVWVVEFKRVEA